MSSSEESSEGSEQNETLSASVSDHASRVARVRQDPGGFVARQQKQAIAAAIFGKPLTPTKLARYTVIRELGSGGMGLVYLAYDEPLDRRVAIKLLRSAKASDEARARLQREAQAMARLSHPNVVTVYEVGTFQGEVFVAMEYVQGQDLRDWLASEARTREAILDVFQGAGEGLAAAHGAGIVHRDFKPDNVLVGVDRRARVADFGLAYGLGHPVDEAEQSEPERSVTSSSGSLDMALTQTGALLGTPAYMSPEQFAGRPSDERSDQFSFCVALWEALFGRRPFSGETLVELAVTVARGHPEASPTDADVPEWLRAALVRGLSPMPEDRWPDMRALLELLGDDPERRRRRRQRFAAATTLTLAAFAGLAWVAASEIGHNTRQRYWNALTEELLSLERERGLRQATDDAERARDATRMSVYRSYRSQRGVAEREDPTVAAALLREVGAHGRRSEAWISAANLSLGRALAHTVLDGHVDRIKALTFAPDAPLLYSASNDGEVRRWELASGRGELLFRHDAAVNTLALSPDGNALLTSSKDGQARLWPTAAGGPGADATLLAQHRGEVTAAIFDDQGRHVVTTSKDSTAQLHDLERGTFETLEAQAGGVYSARFDPAGERVATGHGDGSLRLWQVADGALLATSKDHDAQVFHIHFAGPDRLVSAADDGTTRLRSLVDGAGEARVLADHGHPVAALDLFLSPGRERFVSAAIDGSVLTGPLDGSSEPLALGSHREGVWSAVFGPEGQAIATASFDGSARLLPAEGVGVERVFTGHRQALLRAALDPSGRWLATGGYDTEIRVWDLARVPLELALQGHRGKVLSVETDAVGERVVTASADGSARVWRARDGAELARLEGTRGPLNTAIFSPDGDRVATGSSTGAVVLWDLGTGTQVQHLAHQAGVTDLAFDAEGRRLATASFDGSAKILTLGSDRDPIVLAGHEAPVIRVDFDPAGERLATAALDHDLRIWDTRSGALVVTLSGHEGAITDLARAPDGETLATASDDRTLRIWPDDDPQHALVLRGHEQRVHSLAFDARGTRLVSASDDGSARVWSVDEGALLVTLLGHQATLWGARFVDDERVLTIADDSTLRLWDLASEGPAIVLSGHEGGVTDLALGPRARWAVSASVDGSAKIWHLDQLSTDPELLLERLRRATTLCLSAEQRVLELGEDLLAAEAAQRNCEGGLRE